MAETLALLRGINVGGNTLIRMAALREALEADGFEQVRTYINSGNVIFESAEGRAAPYVEKVIEATFGHEVDVVCFSAERWQAIVADAPAWWGADDGARHNLLALLDPAEMEAVLDGIGEPRPGMERLRAGDGVIYSSVEIGSIGKAAAGSRMAGKPVYKRMTARNYNTALKLAALLNK